MQPDENPLTELRPCAHCGGSAYFDRDVTDPHFCWYVRCLGCGISTPHYSQQGQAADAWNRRTPEPVTIPY